MRAHLRELLRDPDAFSVLKKEIDRKREEPDVIKRLKEKFPDILFTYGEKEDTHYIIADVEDYFRSGCLNNYLYNILKAEYNLPRFIKVSNRNKHGLYRKTRKEIRDQLGELTRWLQEENLSPHFNIFYYSELL